MNGKIKPMNDATVIDNKTDNHNNNIINNEVDIYNYLLENDEEYKQAESNEIMLNEDLYLQYLEKIINRDYYPFHKSKKLSNAIPNNVNIDNYVINFTSDELESLKKIIHDNKAKQLKKMLWMYKKEYLSNKNAPNEKSMVQYSKCIAKNNIFFYPKETHKVLDFLSRKHLNKAEIIKENTRLPEGFVESIQLKEEKKLKDHIIQSIEKSEDFAMQKFINDIEKTPKMKENKVINLNNNGDNSVNELIYNSSKTFTVLETPKREIIANDLIYKYSKRKHKKIKDNIESTSRVGVSVNSELTPGGLRLLNSMKRNNLIFDNNPKKIFSTPRNLSRLSSIRVSKKND